MNPAIQLASVLNSAVYQAANTEVASLPSYHLTPREQDVLALLACGLQNKEIARVLDISAHTVAGYLKDIYRKLGVSNRTAAGYIAIELGLKKSGLVVLA